SKKVFTDLFLDRLALPHRITGQSRGSASLVPIRLCNEADLFPRCSEKPMKKVFKNLRRHAFLASLGAVGGLLISGLVAADTTVRIGFQKSSTLITLLRSQGTLERVLAEHGVKVSWHEFPSGLPLLEALNVGNVDVSADGADTVPVFAQAAGARLVYVARETPSPAAQAILAHGDSPVRELADLKGKRVAVT